MKKFVVLLTLVLLLFGCSNNDAITEVKSEPYSSQEAIRRGDVVFLDKVYNLEGFDDFIASLESKNVDSIRVTSYTDEGDPIFKDLQFDGKAISYTYDDSNDNFGGSNKGIRTDSCSKVVSNENEQGEIDYTVSGCAKNDPEMSYFLFRM
ncbi:hypothetical protein D3C76_105350 [compost metagenome]